jgi:hypothetical protein
MKRPASALHTHGTCRNYDVIIRGGGGNGGSGGNNRGGRGGGGGSGGIN